MADGASVVSFGKTFAGGVADQRVVDIDRGWQVKERLKQDVDGGGFGEVLAPDHMGDVLGRIIHDDRQVIRRAHVAPGQHHVPDGFG